MGILYPEDYLMLLTLLSCAGLLLPMAPAAPMDGGQAGPQALAPQPDQRGVLLLSVAGLESGDLEIKGLPNLHALLQQSAWSSTAWSDPSGDRAAKVGTAVWGVGSWKSRLASQDLARARRRAHRPVPVLAKQARPEVHTIFVADDPRLGGVLAGDNDLDVRSTGSDGDDGGDACVLALAKNLKTAPAPAFAVLVRTRLLPASGEAGSRSSRAAALKKFDSELGAILAALESRPAFYQEKWLIALCGDGAPTDALAQPEGSLPCPASPLLLRGPGFPPGETLDTVNLTDIAPTLLAFLDVPADPEWSLDGRSLSELGHARLGENLIVNAGAELQAGTKEKLEAGILTGWRSAGATTPAAYSGLDGWPEPDSPGPPERGRNFFNGGASPRSRIEQRIDLGPLSEVIRRGKVGYRLEAWLGGFLDQADDATFSVVFVDEKGKVLPASTTLGPGSASVRRKETGVKDGKPLTGLVRFAEEGKVPKQARSVWVILEQTRQEGTNNDGYADELRLVLNAN